MLDMVKTPARETWSSKPKFSPLKFLFLGDHVSVIFF